MESLFSEARLNHYIENDRFRLYLQPQVSVQTGLITGIQAALKMKTRSRELDMQEKTLVRLKEKGLFYRLDLHLLEKVCNTLSQWDVQQKYGGQVSIRFSGNTLERDDIVARIQEVFCRYPQIDSMIRLQISEKTEVKNWKQFYENCHRLLDMGVGLIMDSYGSDYTEPGIPLDECYREVRIDSELTDQMDRRTMDYLKVSVIIDMCKRDGRIVTAENITEEVQCRLLKQLGCDYMIGDFAGASVPADEFENLYLEQPVEQVM